MKCSNWGKGKAASIWGSGLLAVDVVIRTGDSDPLDITSGGTCANVLANLATLGWCASAMGRVGDDPAGAILREHLSVAGVDTSSLILDHKVETPIIVERFGIGDPTRPSHRFEWHCPGCGARVPRFRPTPIPLLKDADFGTEWPEIFFFDRPTPGNLRLARALKAAGTIVMFEPPRIKVDYASRCAIELADIVKVANGPNVELLDEWQKPGSLAVISHGAGGLSYRADKFAGITVDWTSIPAFGLTRHLDACGSGDWLTTGLLHVFFSVNNLMDDPIGRLDAAVRFGQALAALNCLLPGARGLSRVFDHAEISDMVAVVLAMDLHTLEGKLLAQSSNFKGAESLRSVCSSCCRTG